MKTESATVFVVDDDPAIRKALARLLSTAGYHACAFSDAQQFLAQHDRQAIGCILLDVAMPGLSGLELQTALAAAGITRPIIFLTGRGDIPMTVTAMKAGAVDFLTKPIDDERLLAAVEFAVEKDRLGRQDHSEREAIQARLDTLTAREREVLAHVVSGQSNKQIAADLGIVEKTIKVHRGRVMEKMAVESLADLVRVAMRAGMLDQGPIEPAKTHR